jgi:hypothetical protein
VSPALFKSLFLNFAYRIGMPTLKMSRVRYRLTGPNSR